VSTAKSKIIVRDNFEVRAANPPDAGDLDAGGVVASLDAD
jgi:hypothetical protein